MYSLSNHNITSPLSYNIAILPLSHHITGIIAGQVHRVHLNMCKCLGNSYPKNMFSIFLNLHSQSVVFLAKCNLAVLCQKKARFFFLFTPRTMCTEVKVMQCQSCHRNSNFHWWHLFQVRSTWQSVHNICGFTAQPVLSWLVVAWIVLPPDYCATEAIFWLFVVQSFFCEQFLKTTFFSWS